MFYSALGRVVWFGAKWYVRRRYGHFQPPTPVLAGSVLTLAVAVAVIAQRNQSS
jgi:hypothetical protein